MYAYITGISILGAVFLCLFSLRKDSRKAMVYSGALYFATMVSFFIILRLFIYNPSRAITPGYWSPPTLFNLGHKTGGLEIEGMLFMFFIGGIAAASYEIAFNMRTSRKSDNHLKKRHALMGGILAALLIYWLFPVNAIYLLISFQFFAALILMWQRRDLIKHSISGGLLFLGVYSVAFYFFNLLFPHFIASYYNLNQTTHIFIVGVPLEEYLYALSFGMIWAPIYEYEHRLKDIRLLRSGFRRVSLAAGATRR